MNPLIEFKTLKQSNIWELFPVLKLTFKELYNADKTKDKLNSSNVLWGIAFLYEKDFNKYSRLSEAERKQLIKEDILQDDKFDWNNKLVSLTCDKYLKLNITPEERNLLELQLKMEERMRFIKDTPYDFENAKDLDVIFANTGKLQTILDDAKKRVNSAKEVGGEVEGGRKETAMEKGII